MNNPRYFVVLSSEFNEPKVLLEADGPVALFDTKHEADLAGEEHPLGAEFGWEVYPWYVYQ